MIDIYGDFDVLLLVKKFSELTGYLSDKIKSELISTLKFRESISIPPHKITNFIILFDIDEETQHTRGNVQEIVMGLTGLGTRHILSSRFRSDCSEIKNLDEKSVIFIIADDTKLRMSRIHTAVYNLSRLNPKSHIIVLTPYDPFSLKSGEKLKHELAMNLNSIMYRAKIINTRTLVGNRKAVRLLNIIYHVLNFQNYGMKSDRKI